ncbi:MAG: methyltransferase domain-containing protein [Candidatus Bathyarchaeia archaeon]
MSIDKTQKIANNFDDFSEVFSRWSPSEGFRAIFKETVFQIIENECKTMKVLRILDVGCGHGTWISYLLKNATSPSDLRIRGIDLSEKRILLAKQTLSEYSTVSVEVMDFKEMTSKEKYDIVFFSEVIQYMGEYIYHDLFQKCREILAEGGYLVIIDKEKYSFTAFNGRILQILGEVGVVSKIYRYISYPSFRRLSNNSEKNGFQVAKRLTRKNFSALVLRKI